VEQSAILANYKAGVDLDICCKHLHSAQDLTVWNRAIRRSRLVHGISSIRAERVNSSLKFGVVICVMAFSITAFAGSVSTFDYSTKVTGGSNSSLQATFSYNTNTDTFTKETLTFSGGIFNGVQVAITQPQHGDTFTFDKPVDGDTIDYTIVFNPLTGSYDAYGTITKGRTVGSFQYNTTPEGGNQLSYLAASGLALFAGIFLAGKQRRQPAEN
jgi:hypothetical protein